MDKKWELEDQLRLDYQKDIDNYVDYCNIAEDLYYKGNYKDCEEMCFKCIELYPRFRDFNYKLDNIKEFPHDPTPCIEITTLAKLYEKQERYIDAIKICLKGIELETEFEESYHISRINKLIKKCNKNISVDYDNLVIYDENGEVL